MIKFKQKNNKLDDLIDLLYKIINNSYNSYVRQTEQKQLKDYLQNKANQMNPYMSNIIRDLKQYGDLMNKII